ncbi:uncharacterized protein LOC122665467 [Telopea speciosissima]|uniref:uncharacterized protein LOC122665467 n=1 Tax=Telopea speciosissima TaxID=54955 RepID=UPI001CC6B98F|nr:uncharacterized protein LOC122665467 [Telopea speciosissima]
MLWFAKLKPNSIRGFTELAKAFISHFQSSVKQKKTTANLLAIKQRADKSIKDYITRFNAESLEIKDLDDAMAFNALHNEVTNHDLVKSLALDPEMTMPQLLDRCYQYANMFDIMKARKAVDGKAPEKKTMSEKEDKKGDDKRGIQVPKDVIQKGHLRRYIKEARDNPRGRETPRNDWRRDDKAQRGGDWDHQGDQRNNHREVRRNQDETNTSTAPAILTILGGPGQESTRRAKAKARFIAVEEVFEKKARTEPGITFLNKDMEGVSWPHDDAVVVQEVIANRPVHRVLVDTRASVDMLSYDAYLQFGFELGTVKPEAAPLYEFSGAPAPIEGSVELLMTVGMAPCQKTVKVNFMVVRAATAYNAILGRPSLNKLGEAISTKHLKVKFPTPNGIGDCQTE